MDGTWKQVAILPDKDKVMINFDRTEVEVVHPWKMLMEYAVTPFKTQGRYFAMFRSLFLWQI